MTPSTRCTITEVSSRTFRLVIESSSPKHRSRKAGALRRYHVLPDIPSDAVSIRTDDGKSSLASSGAVCEVDDRTGLAEVRLNDETCFSLSRLELDEYGDGFSIGIALTPGERLFGLGDVARDRLDKRGYAAQMWVRNVASYVPIPIVLSSRGWGIYLETTWRHFFDFGSKKPDELSVWSHGGGLSFIVTVGEDLKTVLSAITGVVGRPTMLPMWAYGLTYVCNQEIDARGMIDNCLRFRDRDIPCDVIGLEPGWMSKHYDYSIEKSWHPERFYIPYWSTRGDHTFLAAAARLGFKMSLWLCCDYDLGEIEEQQALEEERVSGTSLSEATQGLLRIEEDLVGTENFGHAPIRLDKLTRPGVPWFDHLKAFVDQGARAFKLDGANQVNEHPDRAWANGMCDEEMHNLYPALLNKQMSRGFEEHTGLRSMIYSSGGYAGIPRFSATWAGDTGGGFGPLVSMLNHGLSGHSNTSCDMDVFSIAGIHFGFLMPWSQLCSWAYWRQPWLLGEQMEAVFKDYAKLRYRLLPYIYSMAHVANRTGIPMMRAMHLEFPDDEKCYERLNQYMFGDAFLVGVFEPRIYLPDIPGGWIDYWTGERYNGGVEVDARVPENRGGALFIRPGAVVPMWPAVSFVGQRKADCIDIAVFTGADGKGVLYEDDGETPAYREGAVAETLFEYHESGQRLTIGDRHGSYEGITDSRRFRIVVDGTETGLEVSPEPDTSLEIEVTAT